MTDVTDIEVIEQVPETPPPPPLAGTVLPNGMYLFFANAPGVAERAMKEYPDLNTFYILAGNAQGKAEWYRVTNLPAAMAINKLTAPLVGLEEVDETASFRLPKMPPELLEKVDRFLREVIRDKGTEAIVMLTYDPEFRTAENPAEGWGVVVPSQENDAGHCDYEPASVVDDKPDHVDLVGSIHSHPNMAAFASGTDHADQAEFDGVHVTYGYPRGLSGATDYHVELQLGGGRWKMDMDQIVDLPEPEEVDNEDLKDWLSKVKKAHAHPTQGGGTGTASTPHPHVPVARTLVELVDPKNRPEGCPDPNTYTIVVNVPWSCYKCPVCLNAITRSDEENRRCLKCFSFLARATTANVMVSKPREYESLEDLVKARKGLNSDQLDFAHPESITHDVVYWERKLDYTNKTTSSEVIVIFATPNSQFKAGQKMPKQDIESKEYNLAGGLPFI